MNPLIIFIAVLALCATSCGFSKPPVETKPQFTIRPLTNIKFEPTAVRLERGPYLSEGVLQCFVCHTDRDWTKPGAPPIAEMKGGPWHEWRIKNLPRPRLRDRGVGKHGPTRR